MVVVHEPGHLTEAKQGCCPDSVRTPLGYLSSVHPKQLHGLRHTVLPEREEEPEARVSRGLGNHLWGYLQYQRSFAEGNFADR